MKQIVLHSHTLMDRATNKTVPIIEVCDLVKRYKRSTINAVNHISFCVTPGSLFALLGPNGAGKTTTIAILTTLLTPTSGTVRIAENDITTQAHVVRRHIGIVFQQPCLDLNLTAEENIRFHAVLYGLYPFRPTFTTMPRSYRQQVYLLAELLGITDSLFKPVQTFSGGMKRKLEIVRSLLHQPRILFLDEPTAGLDPESRHTLWGYLQQVRRESNATLFLTTHYLEEAKEADTICIMNQGRIVSYGTPEQIKTNLASPSLQIDATDRKQLRNELFHLGLPFQETSLFTISLSGLNVHRFLKTIQTPLSLIRIYEPTLEDAYLKIVRNE